MEARASRRLLIVAGESSGDRHAARMVAALRDLGRVEVRGVAGPAMVAQGVHAIAAAETLAVVGFTGVLGRLGEILAVRRRLLAEAKAFRPHAAVLVDSPGFNFRVGPALRRAGVRIFYYIAPQVWAWHAERARQMARWVDRLAVVFPFEEPLFREAGVDARFVGHPLLDDPPPVEEAACLRERLGLPADARLVGLLPGSRSHEWNAHLGTMVEAARRLARDRPGVHGVVAVAPGLEHLVPAELQAVGAVRAAPGITRALQHAAECCAVASGTATLETALAGTPLAIVYRTGRLNYALARRLVTLDRVGLPNIVAGEDVAPELIQDDFEPGRLAATLARWLDDPSARAEQCARLAGVRSKLGEPGAARRTAELVWELMGSD